jgi:hypothetical protein
MKGKKVLFLFLALLLPACVFVFLKMFGKNEFEVPLLHQEGTIEPSPECNFNYATPYTISDSVMSRVETEGSASLYLLSFSNDEAVISRLKTEAGEEGLRFVAASRLAENAGTRQKIKDCILLSKTTDLVLLDNQKRIRGYYSTQKLDDVDRLILEIKIILKKY